MTLIIIIDHHPHSCFDALVAPHTRSFPALDLAQLTVQRDNLQLQFAIQDVLSQPAEGLQVDPTLLRRLDTTVLSANELYQLANQYQFDRIALKILRNERCSDESLVRHHWNQMLMMIIRGATTAKYGIDDQ